MDAALRMVLRTDARNAVRDRTIGAFAVVPFIFVALLRVGYPLLEDELPAAADHRAILLSVFCVIAATFPAFMLSTIALDEKDQHLTDVMRVLPVPPQRSLALRAAVAAALGFVSAAVVLFGSGLAEQSPAAGLVRCALCGLTGPAALLAAVSLAANKIEGLALFKGIFLVAAVACGAGAAQSAWRHVLAVVPVYWTARAFEATDALTLAWTAVVSVLAHAALVAIVVRRAGLATR